MSASDRTEPTVPADPDDADAAAVRAILSSREWEERLARAREERREVLARKAAGQPAI